MKAGAAGAVIVLACTCSASDPSYERDIRPVLEGSCVSCHGADKDKGGFSADTLDNLLTSGDNGPWVRPGDPAGSKLLALLSGEIRTKKAADKHVLPAAKVRLLRDWIAADAR